MTPRPSPRESSSAAPMCAGTGILHSDKNDAWRLQRGDEHRRPAHFVPMWVVPDEGGSTPGHEQFEIDDALLTGGLFPVASGMSRHRGAARAPFLHLFVPRGTMPLEGTGDAVRCTATEATTGGQRTSATEAAEVLVRETPATVAT